MESTDRGGVEDYRRRLAAVTIGAPEPLPGGRVVLSAYDPEWAQAYAREAARITVAIGSAALRVEHVGSTSVPGLPAKPIVDVCLEVADSSDEDSYVPALQAAGYVLAIREPDWFEHRLLKDPRAGVHVHVFSSGCAEVGRMLRFRERLRTDAADRGRYARAKLELAARSWTYVQQYADAKSEVIAAILARA